MFGPNAPRLEAAGLFVPVSLKRSQAGQPILGLALRFIAETLEPFALAPPATVTAYRKAGPFRCGGALAWSSHARCELEDSQQREGIKTIKSESGRQPTLALICNPQLLQKVAALPLTPRGNAALRFLLAKSKLLRSLEGDR
jgi:hypothetical protein